MERLFLRVLWAENEEAYNHTILLSVSCVWAHLVITVHLTKFITFLETRTAFNVAKYNFTGFSFTALNMSTMS